MTETSARRNAPAGASPAPAGLRDPAMLHGGAAHRMPTEIVGIPARDYDHALRWLTASDQKVASEIARALVEVRDKKLYLQQGHSRWTPYLRAFVGRTARWAQYEMQRHRALMVLPVLAEDFEEGRITRSHLRLILPVATPETQDLWVQRGRPLSVRELEKQVALERLVRRQAALARSEAPGETTAAPGAPAEAGGDGPAPPRRRRRVVMAPLAVAVLVAEAVEVARKLEGYHIGTGRALEMMAMETLAGLPSDPDAAGGTATAGGSSDAPAETETPEGRTNRAAGSVETLGDHDLLRRELGAEWARIHEQMEKVTRLWSDLPRDLPDVLLHGALATSAPAHRRLVFWIAVQRRLDALRGRLLRVVRDLHLPSLGFAGLGPYVRERMGLSLSEAQELIRLDEALCRLPVAFRMYAAGRLTRCAAWLVCRVTTPVTDRAWTRFALTHTHRLLEAAVEASVLQREIDPKAWRRGGGLPPPNTSFADASRMCSLLRTAAGLAPEPTARIQLPLDSSQQVVYRQALDSLRAAYGAGRPEWWYLGALARHFLDTWQHVDDDVRRTIARKVIQRDNYTCAAPECLQRGGLEADHIDPRSNGGGDEGWNQVSECHRDHHILRHGIGSLRLWGRAPDGLYVTAGSRVYRKDRLIRPVFHDAQLDAGPWAGPMIDATRWS